MGGLKWLAPPRRWIDRVGALVNAALRLIGLRLVRRAAHDLASQTLGKVIQCHLADEALVHHLKQWRPAPTARQAEELEALVYSHGWNRTYERHLEPLREFLQRTRLSNAYRFLDVGCAVGQLLPHLHQMNFDGHYVGIDIGGPLLSIAHRRAAPGDRPIHFIRADAACLPLTTGSFDIVFSRSTLVAQQDWKMALREMLRVASKWVILLDTPLHQGNEETAHFMQFSKNHAAMLCTFTREAFERELPARAHVHVIPGEASEILNFGNFQWHHIVIELT